MRGGHHGHPRCHVPVSSPSRCVGSAVVGSDPVPVPGTANPQPRNRSVKQGNRVTETGVHRGRTGPPHMARPCMTQPVRILLSSTDMLDPKRCHIHPHARREGVPEHRPVYPTSHPTDSPTTHHTHVIWSHPHRRTRLQPARTGKEDGNPPKRYNNTNGGWCPPPSLS